MLPPGGSVDSWYMMRAVRQPFPSCFRRSQKEVQKRRESSLQINVRGIAGSAFEQRAYLAQERVHLLRAATDIGLWPQQNGEVFCMHGKSRLCRQLLRKVAGLAFLHPYGNAGSHRRRGIPPVWRCGGWRSHPACVPATVRTPSWRRLRRPRSESGTKNRFAHCAWGFAYTAWRRSQSGFLQRAPLSAGHAAAGEYRLPSDRHSAQ